MPTSAIDLTPGTVTRIEALGYRTLRYVAQDLRPFQVLLGANGSGKSSFLDVIALFGDLLRDGAEGALHSAARLGSGGDAEATRLTWMGQSLRFELVLEMAIPAAQRAALRHGPATVCRYEVGIDVSGPIEIATETLWLKPSATGSGETRPLPFPETPPPPAQITHPARRPAPPGWKKVVSRGEEPQRVMFLAETSGWHNPFRIAPQQSALASLPADEERFPVATWLRDALARRVRHVAPASAHLRRPSPPSQPPEYLPDGANLPQVADALERGHPDRHRRWLDCVHSALPDLVRITTRERPEDRHRYLLATFQNGLEVPSWLLSDGTLRLLALTLLAYLPEHGGLYLIEEPETGLHPTGIEAVLAALSSIRTAQVLLTSHSPLIARLADPEAVLLVERGSDGASRVVPGPRHPRLAQWRRGIEPEPLFARGVLT